jgi:hypothetical protein
VSEAAGGNRPFSLGLCGIDTLAKAPLVVIRYRLPFIVHGRLFNRAGVSL